MQVILAPSPKYTGMADDPPRYMGEGFVVLSSNNVELYYYMDEPGIYSIEIRKLLWFVYFYGILYMYYKWD